MMKASFMVISRNKGFQMALPMNFTAIPKDAHCDPDSYHILAEEIPMSFPRKIV